VYNGANIYYYISEYWALMIKKLSAQMHIAEARRTRRTRSLFPDPITKALWIPPPSSKMASTLNPP
jgi:hypothetical protein